MGSRCRRRPQPPLPTLPASVSACQSNAALPHLRDTLFPPLNYSNVTSTSIDISSRKAPSPPARPSLISLAEPSAARLFYLWLGHCPTNCTRVYAMELLGFQQCHPRLSTSSLQNNPTEGNAVDKQQMPGRTDFWEKSELCRRKGTCEHPGAGACKEMVEAKRSQRG